MNEGDLLYDDRRMNSITGRVLSIPAASVTNSGASSSRALHVDLTSQQVHAESDKLIRCHWLHLHEARRTAPVSICDASVYNVSL